MGSLCNVLAGDKWNGQKFKVDAGAKSCTQKTQFTNGDLFGNGEKVTVIDSVGFDDPDNKDVQIIGEMVDQLNNNCDFINLFVIVINDNKRVEKSLKTILSVFEGMFGQDFWKQAVVCFTRIRMREKDIERRLESNQNKSDDDMAKGFLSEIHKSFPSSKDVQWIRLDTHYKDTNENEKKEFDAATEKVKDLLETNNRVLGTEEIRRLEKQIPAYKQKFKEIEKEKKDLEKKYRDLEERAILSENELKKFQEFVTNNLYNLFLITEKKDLLERSKQITPRRSQEEQEVQQEQSRADGCGCWPLKCFQPR